MPKAVLTMTTVSGLETLISHTYPQNSVQFRASVSLSSSYYLSRVYFKSLNPIACPALPPTHGQPCSIAPDSAQDCYYAGGRQCFASSVFSCVQDVSTGNSSWQISTCPAKGCDTIGECLGPDIHHGPLAPVLKGKLVGQ